MTSEDIIRTLELKPHPEGGHYAETHRIPDPHDHGHRSPGTAIYYLLAEGERSHWHKVDATEIWHYYAGAPLALHRSEDGGSSETLKLGTDIAGGERPQAIIPANWWQSAETLGDYTLVGCTVAPGFEFSKFEMAPPDWKPGS